MAPHLEFVNLQNRGFDYLIRVKQSSTAGHIRPRLCKAAWKLFEPRRNLGQATAITGRMRMSCARSAGNPLNEVSVCNSGDSLDLIKLAQSLQTFKSMLRDLGVLVHAFSEIDLDLQEFKRKAADIYSNLHDVLGAAVNTRDNFDTFAGSVIALDEQMTSLEASAQKMKASMLEDLDVRFNGNIHPRFTDSNPASATQQRSQRTEPRALQSTGTADHAGRHGVETSRRAIKSRNGAFHSSETGVSRDSHAKRQPNIDS
jgi:hypothetical protein